MAHFFTQVSQAQDPMVYLSYIHIQPIEDESHFDRRGAWRGRDSYGRAIRVFPNLSQRQRDHLIRRSFLSDLLGVAHRPTYPAFYQDQSGKIRRVLVQLLVERDAGEPLETSHLSGKQKSPLKMQKALELLTLLSIEALLGNSSIDLRHFKLSSNHVIYDRPPSLETSPSLVDSSFAKRWILLMEAIPHTWWRSYWLDGSTPRMIDYFRGVLTRLEALQSLSPRRFSYRVKTDELRESLIDFFTKKLGITLEEGVFRKKQSLPEPHFKLPPLRHDLPRPTPLGELWRAYFLSSEPIDPQWYTRRRSLSSQDTLHIPYVAPSLTAKWQRHGRREQKRSHFETVFQFPQTELRKKNQETLVVVPMNDPEGMEITQIARKSGAKVLELDLPKGAYFDGSIATQVEKWLNSNPRKRIRYLIIHELRPKSRDKKRSWAAHFRSRGVHSVWVDHHGYYDWDLHHPLSSLEQIALRLGYRLGPASKMIAVNDRSGALGLRDLGLSSHQLQAIVPRKSPRQKNRKKARTKQSPDRKWIEGSRELWIYERPESSFPHEARGYISRSILGSASPEAIAVLSITQRSITLRASYEMAQLAYLYFQSLIEQNQLEQDDFCLRYFGDLAREIFVVFEVENSALRWEAYQTLLNKIETQVFPNRQEEALVDGLHSCAQVHHR